MPAPAFAQRANDTQGFPVKPIRIVVPFSPGGVADITARVIGPKLVEAWRQPVVVDNRPGAGGVVGTEIVANVDAVHVPYKGIPEALTDTVAGRVQFFMPPLSSVTTFIKDGRLVALAVSTQARVSGFPDIPTIAESGVAGYQWNAWTALLAPAKTPRSIVNQLHREVSRILNLPEVQLRMAAIGAEVAAISPQQLDKMIAAEIALTTQIARKAGIKAD